MATKSDNTKPKQVSESRVRANLNKLRTVPGMEAAADSLERLLDGAVKGGTARANSLSPKRRSAIASKAAKARWDKKPKKKVKQ